MQYISTKPILMLLIQSQGPELRLNYNYAILIICIRAKLCNIIIINSCISGGGYY